MTDSGERAAAWLQAGSRAAALFAAMVGILVLLGWLLGIRVLQQVFPGLVAMAPNAAVGLLLAGSSLWLQTGTTAQSRLRGSRVAAVAAGLLGLLTFAEYVSGMNLGIDEILFRDTAALSRPFPGRMAGAAALCFVILAAALVLASLRRAQWLAESLAMIVGLLALLALTGYAYGVQGLYSIGLYKGIAIHAALALFVLALGVLLVCTGSFSRLIVSDTAGGVVARWFLPVALGVPFLLGWLRLVGQQAGLYGTEFGRALYAVSDTVVLIAILWPLASRLMRTDEERKLNEHALRESERRFRSLVTATSQMVWSTDGEGRVTGPIPTWQAYTGQTDEEIMGSGWASALHPGDVQPALAAWTHAVEAKTPYDVEYRIRGRDGVYRHFSARGVPMLADDGAIQEWVGTCTDITERRQAEEAVRNAEVRYRAIFEQSPNGVLLIEAETGKTIEANETAHKQLGYTHEEFAALVVFDYEASETPEEAAKHMRRIVHDGIGDFETLHRTKSGEIRNVHVWAKTIRLDERVLFYAIFQDITKRKRAEQELWERTEELARSNRELEHFAYVASHDLQEPLRMVSSFTELLGRRYKGKLDADADEFIAYAVEGATRMQTMINDLLAYSRVGSKGGPVGPVDCHSVLAQALANLSVAIEESQALVTSDPLPTVPANATELTQLLQNLIANAIKFRSEGLPVVHVSARRPGAEWVFSVRDNGIGIAPEHCERIFVIFQRLNPRDRYSGTGIGLAICKKIVERHRGRIWVESEPGGGSTFFFTIPAKEKATA